MSMPQPGIYSGRVIHRRHRGTAHALQYRLFYLLLDLDRLEDLAEKCRVLAVNRKGLLAFREGDHGPGVKREGRASLAARIRRLVSASGYNGDISRVMLLTMPRVFGYGFNPISVYFGYAPDGELTVLVYEVNNTFGERHHYVVPAGDERPGGLRHSAVKRLHVSPFFQIAGQYAFRIHPPAERFSLDIAYRDDEGTALTAGLRLKRAPLTDRGLLTASIQLPLQSFKVIWTIHWQAFRLWLKGLPFYGTDGHAIARGEGEGEGQPSEDSLMRFQ